MKAKEAAKYLSYSNDDVIILSREKYELLVKRAKLFDRLSKIVSYANSILK